MVPGTGKPCDVPPQWKDTGANKRGTGVVRCTRTLSLILGPRSGFLRKRKGEKGWNLNSGN